MDAALTKPNEDATDIKLLVTDKCFIPPMFGACFCYSYVHMSNTSADSTDVIFRDHTSYGTTTITSCL